VSRISARSGWSALAASFAGVITALALAACDGASSTLESAGVEADLIARRFWIMATGAAAPITCK